MTKPQITIFVFFAAFCKKSFCAAGRRFYFPFARSSTEPDGFYKTNAAPLARRRVD